MTLTQTADTTGSVEATTVDLLVIGAHLRGQPLNGELQALGASLVEAVRTAPSYRLFALDTVPPKAGLLRVNVGGNSVRGERWRLPTDGFGRLVAELPSPMTIGPVELDDGDGISGFLVEAAAVATALDITAYGGWIAYLRR